MSGNLRTESLSRLIGEFARLPGVGEKTAERLALHVLRAPREEALALSRAIEDVKANVRACSRCFNVSEQDPCSICADTKRDHTVVCVVEQPSDLWAIEGSGAYRGTYHVLGGRIAPVDGIGPEHLTVSRLLDRVRDGVREVILATNPTMEGDGTALHLRSKLEPRGITVTRIARGLPSGGTLQHASRAVVADAIGGRTALAGGPRT
ncbi:MAG: recombination protein RecR [Candidatus Brocadiae bacterium]|nr:recombination protein RecR [Candidatus Brocadiia bacterium]